MVESSSVLGRVRMSEERFDRIDVTLAAVGATVTRLDASVSGVDTKVGALTTAVSKLTLLHEETRDHCKVIAEGFVATNQRVDSVDGRLDSVGKGLGSVDHRHPI